MSDNFLFAQLQNFSLAGAGAILGATSVILSSFKTIDGVNLAMTDFGSIGFGTLEPGNGTLEEQICFTGVTQNSNGTATLTGVSSVLFLAPYTQSSGLAKTHAGATTFVISNTSGFYDKMTSKDDDETVTGLWTFPNGANTPILGTSYVAPTLNNQVASKGYADSLSFAGAPDATTTQKGIVELATQAEVDARTATGGTSASLVATPALNRTVLTHDSVTSAVGTDSYAITLTPAVTAYTTGDVYHFKADVANTGACTLAVNGLTAINLKTNKGLTPPDNYIVAGSFVHCMYDGTNMQILSVGSTSQLSQSFKEVYGATATGNDTYVITVQPVPIAYAKGQVFMFSADVGNTGAASLNVNALGALNILRADGSALATGDIGANQLVEVMVFDGTTCRLLSPVALAPAFASGISTAWSMNTASGTLNIAHGFGRAPRYVRISCMIDGTDETQMSVGVFNGSTTATIYANGNNAASDTTNIVHLIDIAATPHSQVATISVDATNIALAFTLGGTNGSEIIRLLWEAMV